MMERGLSSPLSFFLTVIVIKPSTTGFISEDKVKGYSNDSVVLTVKEENYGDMLLTNRYVTLDSTKLEKTSPEYFGGDTNDDGTLILVVFRSVRT